MTYAGFLTLALSICNNPQQKTATITMNLLRQVGQGEHFGLGMRQGGLPGLCAAAPPWEALLPPCQGPAAACH